MLARPEAVIAPGIYDGISARLASEVIIARADAAQGFGLEEAISRSKPASAPGADLLFYRVLVEFVTGEFTPNLTAKEERAIGVKIISCLSPEMPTVQAVWASLLLKRTADVNSSRGMGPKDFFKHGSVKLIDEDTL
ncbi:hypothetical protein F5890DRAFT_1476995 [Lentinula detonsa]|uniref:Uncharacterized protein n=1 Tax=Lentinula detonsa TaxID=2804962 RepID=A0AA38PTE3_9AGAR|nr:hypothetical protein F5890DRAFT_1476995 [Lentinula detonsa]